MIAFAGQRVLVTGGSRGVGRSVALAFARAGADVALTYHTHRDAAESVAAEIRALGRTALVSGGAHDSAAAAEALLAPVDAAWGRLDHFIGNAGIWPVADVALRVMPEARWTATHRANLDAIFHTTQAALRRMTQGSVVLVSSTAGQRGEAFHADYASTKGALIALTKSLAVECAPAIRVNCVAPGWIDTDMSAGVLQGDHRARVAAAIPVGRIASADDIAGPIAFLASELARHVTGEILNVNGGSVLCG